MDITYDTNKNKNKNAVNLIKHGIALSEAEFPEWNTLAATEDARQNYGEARMIGYALLGTRLYCIVFTDRGNERHIISLRKANTREVERYADQN